MKTQANTVFAGRTWYLFGMYGISISDSGAEKQRLLLSDATIVAKSTMLHLGAHLVAQGELAEKTLLGDFSHLPTRPYPTRYYHIVPESYIAVCRRERERARQRALEICALLTAGYITSGSPMQIAGFSLSPASAGWTTTSEPRFEEAAATQCTMQILGNELIHRSPIEVTSEALCESHASGTRLVGPSYEWDISRERPIIQLLGNPKRPNRLQRVVTQMALLLNEGLSGDRSTAFTTAFTAIDALLTGSGGGGSQVLLEKRIAALFPSPDPRNFAKQVHDILVARNNYTHRGDAVDPNLVLPCIGLAYKILDQCALAAQTFKEPEEYHMFLDVHIGTRDLQVKGYSIGTAVAARGEDVQTEGTQRVEGTAPQEGGPVSNER